MFLEKSCKIAAASGNPHWPPAPPDPRVVTPSYWYSFVEYVSSVNRILLTSKNNRSNKQQMFCFCAYFLFQTLQFLWCGERRRKTIFCLPGTGYPATSLTILCMLIYHHLRILDFFEKFNYCTNGSIILKLPK